MSVIPTVSADGIGVVSAGQLNAYAFSCYNIGVLRSITGQTGMTAYLQGTNVPADGGQGVFWWNYASVAPDNNSTVIVPYGVTAGAWNRLTYVSTAEFLILLTATANALPTTLPSTAGVLWNNGGTLCIS